MTRRAPCSIRGAVAPKVSFNGEAALRRLVLHGTDDGAGSSSVTFRALAEHGFAVWGWKGWQPTPRGREQIAAWAREE